MIPLSTPLDVSAHFNKRDTRPKFGRLNWRAVENEIIQNEVLNRSVIDLIGYEPWVIGFSRNKLERIEKALDGLAWFTIGLGLPLLIQKPLSSFYERVLRKKFDLKPNGELLNTSFADLTHHKLKVARPEAKKLAQHMGLTDVRKVGALAKWVKGFKLAIVAVDLFFMAAKGSIYFWGRNALTEKLADKKGFSGEMNTATDAQLKVNTEDYEASKDKHQVLTWICSVLGVVGLPLALFGLMRSKAMLGKGFMGRAKKLLPAFDYHKKIYMSKWVMFWSNLFTWNITGYLAARSTNEKREHVVKSVIMDAMMFVGDSIIAGTTGLWMAKKAKDKLGGVKLHNTGLFGIPVERSVFKVRAEAKEVGSEALKVADKLARRSFRMGLLGTSLILGIGTTIANNHYTTLKLIGQKRALVKQWAGLFHTPLRQGEMKHGL